MLKVFGFKKPLIKVRARALLALALILSVFSLFSCANDVDIDDFYNPEAANPAERVVFSGQLNLDGAVPQALTKIYKSEIIGRAALPSVLNADGAEYVISAVCTSPAGINDPIRGEVNPDSKTYTIGLTIGRTYTVTASLQKTVGDSTTVYLSDSWKNVTPTRENTSFSHDFMLKPVEGGKGTIQLEMTVPSGTIVEVSGDDWDALSPKPRSDVDGTTATITGSEIPAGIYNVSINFYKTQGSGKILLYSIPQAINIFSNMKTDTWQDGGIQHLRFQALILYLQIQS